MVMCNLSRTKGSNRLQCMEKKYLSCLKKKKNNAIASNKITISCWRLWGIYNKSSYNILRTKIQDRKEWNNSKNSLIDLLFLKIFVYNYLF